MPCLRPDTVPHYFMIFSGDFRLFIWRYLLKLPENTEAYKALSQKGIHPSFANLAEKYPVRSSKLFRSLQRTCSALAFWSELFGETTYLPLLAFPFVKLFQGNQLQAFEVLATVLSAFSTLLANFQCFYV
ncbi:unnamed protein product [Dibothriocephalus latus]|uniref:Uncharacterized protein n=1 Tax=Dibothriocephalus latus TaxID=60516 RepID=A0A3P7NRH1_DIBLA|nr:unnamed protein product [Dibothriocephalus latus]